MIRGIHGLSLPASDGAGFPSATRVPLVATAGAARTVTAGVSVKTMMIRSVVVCAAVWAIAPRVAAAGNLLPNASFEVCSNYRHITGSAGWGRFQMTDPRTLADPTQRTWYVDDTTAYHGTQSVCVYQYLESQFVPVTAGAPYTVSLYAKAGAPATVRMSFISGERTAYVPDGPRFQQEFKLTTEWQRLTMTGRTEGKDPCAYALVVEVYGRFTPVWIDAVQVETGTAATPFVAAHRVEAASWIIDRTPALGIYFQGETPALATRAFVDGAKEGRADFVHRILDHRGDETDRIERTTEIDGRGLALDEISLPADRFGAFRVETDVRVGNETVPFAGEAIFLIVPRIPAQFDDPAESRFGSRFILPPFPREGAPRFLPSWIDGEAAILAKAGAKPPYNYAVVTAAQARKLGIRWVRWSPTWRYVEPERGRFSWADADSVIDKLEELGFKIQFQFASSPQWSHPDEPDGRAPPDDLADWANFLGAVAVRYRGRFEAVEIWNESFSNFLGTADEYVALLKVAHETLKQVDDGIEVLGVSACKPSYVFRMTREILERAGTGYMDAMSYHQKLFGEMPDEMTHSWDEEIGKLHDTMVQFGGDKPMWNTESQAWTEPFYRKLVRGAGGASRSVPRMSVVDAAAGLVRYHVISIANNVVRFQYFGTYNSRGSVISSWTGHDLLDFPLTESLYEPDYSPRPLAAAHAALAAHVAGATFRDQLRFGDDDRGRAFLFDGGHGPLAVIWALRARTSSGTLDWGDHTDAITVVDIMGNERARTRSMPLGAEPVYVRAATLDALKTAVSAASLTGLPVIDRLSDSPLLETCLQAGDEKGNLELVVRVINATPKAIRPRLNVGLATNAVAILPTTSTLPLLACGRAAETRFRVTPGRRIAMRTNLSVDVHSEAEPASLSRPLEIAYALATSRPVVIDGDLSEWDGGGVIRLGEKRDVAPGLPWDGAADLSGEVMLRWDAAKFYVGARVTDDHLDRHPDRARIWDGTGLELFFDVDLLHDMEVADYNADDYHYIFAPATSAERGDAFVVSDDSASTKLDGIEMKSKRTARGYDIEIALPRRIFDYEPWLGGAGKKFAKGHAFGIGMSLNDAAKDRTARKTMLIWGGTVDNWRNPSRLATVVMVEGQ